MLLYRILADATAIVHFSFVYFVVIGQVLILIGWACGWQWVRNFWFRLIHLSFIGIVVAEAACDVRCPLTIWEDALRVKAGQAGYPGDFLAYWLGEFLNWEDIEHSTMQLKHMGFGAVVLVTFLFCPPRFPRLWYIHFTAAALALIGVYQLTTVAPLNGVAHILTAAALIALTLHVADTAGVGCHPTGGRSPTDCERGA